MNFNDIAAKYIDNRDSLTEQEFEVLLRAMEEDPQALQQVKEQITLDELLSRELGNDRTCFADQVAKRFEAERDGQRFQKQVETRVRDQAKRRSSRTVRRTNKGVRRSSTGKRWVGIVWASIAACIAIIAGAHFYNVKEAEETPELVRAHLIQVSKGVTIEREGRTLPAKAGMEIVIGDTIQTHMDQKAEIRYNNEDTIISCGGATEIRLEETQNIKNVYLKQGTVKCSVAPQGTGTGFRVTSEFANADVKGTVFTVAASQDKTRLEVLEGAVDFSNASGTDRVNVTQGFFAQAGSSGRIVTDRISTVAPEQERIRLPFTDTSEQGARVDIGDDSLTMWKDSPSSSKVLGTAAYIKKFDPGDTVNVTGELILGPAAGLKEYGAYAEFETGNMDIRLVFDTNGRVALESRKEAGGFTTHAQRTLNAEELFTFNLTVTPGRAVCYVNSRLLYEGETFFRPGSAYSFWFRSFCLQPGKVAVFRNISVDRNPEE